MQLNSVSKITRTAYEDLLIVKCEIVDADGITLQVEQPYRESDPYGVNPLIKDWIEAHPTFPITPYSPPAPPTAEALRANMLPLSARQFRLGLVAGGKTPSQVTAVIDAMPEGTAKETAKIEWEYATTFNRTHPLIATLGGALELTPEEIDDLWINAVNL